MFSGLCTPRLWLLRLLGRPGVSRPVHAQPTPGPSPQRAGWEPPKESPRGGGEWTADGKRGAPQAVGRWTSCPGHFQPPTQLCELSRSPGLPGPWFPHPYVETRRASEGCGKVTRAGGLGPSCKECAFPRTLGSPAPRPARLPLRPAHGLRGCHSHGCPAWSARGHGSGRDAVRGRRGAGEPRHLVTRLRIPSLGPVLSSARVAGPLLHGDRCLCPRGWAWQGCWRGTGDSSALAADRIGGGGLTGTLLAGSRFFFPGPPRSEGAPRRQEVGPHTHLPELGLGTVASNPRWPSLGFWEAHVVFPGQLGPGCCGFRTFQLTGRSPPRLRDPEPGTCFL